MSCAAACLLAWPASAQAAQLVCEWPQYHFGQRQSGGSVEASFRLRNISLATVQITGVRSSCSCTVPQLQHHRLDPGEETVLVAHLSLVGRVGPQRETITVHTSDPAQPSLQLVITGLAVRHLAVIPEALYLGPVPKGHVLERTVDLVAEDQRPFRLLEVAGTDPAFQATVWPLPGATGYRVHLRLACRWSLGPVRQAIRLTTDHPEQPVLEAPILAHVIEHQAGPEQTPPSDEVSEQADRPSEQSVAVINPRRSNL